MEKEVVGTCALWGGRVQIYGYQKELNSVLVKVYPNICNDFKEYAWQRYGVDKIILNKHK